MDAINPFLLEDCFLFPENSLFHVIKDWGYYTSYTHLFYFLFPKESIDPFSSNPNSLGGNYRKLDQLLKNYYYVVYFTSKIVDPSSGKS